MNQQMTFADIVAGIQTMNVLIGDSDASGRSVATNLVGLGATLLGLIAVWRVQG